MKSLKIGKHLLKKNKRINLYNKPTKFNLKIGYPIRIFYFLVIKKKRKVFSFLGFCLSLNYNNLNFCLANTWGNQFLKITFPLVCPFIISLHRNYKYNFLKFRITKFYFKKKIKIKDLTPIINQKTVQYNIFLLLLNKFFFSVFLLKKYRKHFKKIKKKFRY